MSQSLLEVVENFVSPHNLEQLHALGDAVASVTPQNCGAPEIKALLGLFERFPEEDGYGIFWSIVHLIEACGGYEAELAASVTRCPTEFNLLMVNRLLNAGVSDIDGKSLLALLVEVTANPNCHDSARLCAQEFVAHQRQQARVKRQR